MAIRIEKRTLGPLRTNAYLIGDTQTGDAVLIDPVDDGPQIVAWAESLGWRIREMLATHAHFDHVMGAAEVKRLTGATFRAHEAALPGLRVMPDRVKHWLGLEVPPAPQPDALIAEGDVITLGAIRLEMLFTPGHAPGHVSFVLRSEKTVFSGDVLFMGGVGRWDLPGADRAALMASIREKLLPLGDEFVVATGHGENTTIGQERRTNPYLLASFDGD